jgi:hypothetical protein
MNQKIECENKQCKKIFTLFVKVGPEKKGLYDVYFECPHCKQYYLSYYENQQTMSIQDQINEYNNAIQISRNVTNTKKGDFLEAFNKRQALQMKVTKLKRQKKLILEKINNKKH